MIEWILLYIFGCGVLAFLMLWALPKMFLKNSYRHSSIADRGIGKYKISDTDKAIVFEPAMHIRQYISKYVIFERDGEKYISFQLESGVRYIDFDITLFDKDDKGFLSLCSKNILDDGDEIREMKLPANTAYASISLNRVNEQQFDERYTIEIKKGSFFVYMLTVIAVSVGFSLLSKLCFANVLAGVFRQDFMADGYETFFMILSACASLAVGFVSYFVLLGKLQRKSK